MKWLKSNFLYLLGILIPAFFVFNSFFDLSNPLAWGDAPHFFAEEIRELTSLEPYAWITRGISFGGVNPRVYIFPLLSLYSFIGNLAGHNIAIRIAFYFPAIILSAIGPALLAKYLKQSKVVQFFASLFYLLNTYFLLLVDGGQVGVALAYGIFPLTILFLLKLMDRPSLGSFYAALVIIFLNTIADPRIAAVALLTVILWIVVEKLFAARSNFRGLKYLIILVLALAGLSLYWLVPLINVPPGELSASVTQLGLTSLLNSLTTFSAHWPANIFGKVVAPPFYFLGIPILIFSGFLIKPSKKQLASGFLFLTFVFLAKGTTPPLGQPYGVLTSLPFGFAFRDSTKFFVPAVLFAGILIGQSVEKLSLRFRAAPIFAYGFLLVLIPSALFGKMNFVLSKRQASSDLQKIYENLKEDGDESRAAWIPTVHPLTFETQEKQSIDGVDLVEQDPMARMNTGSFDRFNFFHNDSFVDWFKTLGIKYLILSGNPRVVKLGEEEEKLWSGLRQTTATASGLVKKDWRTDADVYEIEGINPSVYAVEQLYAVVGPPVSDQPVAAVYFEDGKLDPTDLERLASQSASIVFNNKSEEDLSMSFLQKYFYSSSGVNNNEWASYTAKDYLISKYQLLLRNFDFKDFDYGRGIVFSDQGNEKIEIMVKVKETAPYKLAIRAALTSEVSRVDWELGNNFGGLIGSNEEQLAWSVADVNLKKGRSKLVLTNVDGLNLVNVVAIVPISEFDIAEGKATTFVKHFGKVDSDEVTVQEIKPLTHEVLSPTRVEIENTDAYWTIFTQNFHDQWKLGQGALSQKIASNSVPVYSMVNAFYTDPKWKDLEIVFVGQKQVRWGMWATAVSTLSLVIIYLWFKPGGKSK